MPPILNFWTAWFQRGVPWSNSRQAWKERAAIAVLVVGLASIIWFGGRLSTTGYLLSWGLLFAALAVLSRIGWIQLFGPLLFYDLVRTARRSRLLPLRILYAFCLFILLLLGYVLRFSASQGSLWEVIVGASLPSRELANFAASFFYAFIAIQFLAVLALVPAYLAGAIVEEKERGTLESFLVTDLRNREIVLSMVVSRLGTLLLVVFTGLPILAFLQLLNGIDPNLVVAGFVATGLTMIGLAGVAILNSVYARRTRDAILRTYLVVAAYLVLSGLSRLLLSPALGLAAFPSTDAWISPISLEDVVGWLNSGNFATLTYQLVQGVFTGGRLDVLLVSALRRYAWFQGVVTAGCMTWAIIRVRSLALGQKAVPARRKISGQRSGQTGLGMGSWPMLWKTLVVEVRSRRGPLGLLLGGLLLAALLWPAIHLLCFFGRVFPAGPEDPLCGLVNLWVRAVSTLVGCFLLLGVAVRASAGISGERERQTLDGLLATTLQNRSILFGKWLGSIANGRRPWFWLAGVWTVGIITGALHPLAVPFFVVAWLIYAAFLAGLGLWFSVASRSGRRALIATLVSCLVGMFVFLLAAFDLAEGWLTTPEAYSLLPPETLGLLAFSPANLNDWVAGNLPIRARLIFLALGLCASAAVVLWFLVGIRFRVVTGRERLREVEIAMPEKTKGAVRSSNQIMIDAPPPASPAKWSRLRLAYSLLPWRRLPSLIGRTVFVSLPLALLLGFYAHLLVTRDQSLQEAIEEADRLDPGWRFEELEAKLPTVPADQNSAVQVLTAQKLFRKEWTQIVSWTGELPEAEPKPKELEPQFQLDSQQLALVRGALETCKPMVVEARRLADMPQGRSPHPVDSEGLAVQPYLAQVHQAVPWLARLLSYDVLLRVEEGDADGALASCRAILNAGRAVGDEPSPWGQRDRSETEAIAAAKIERTLAQGRPSDEALAALQRLLADEASQSLFLLQLRGDRANNDRLFELAAKGKPGLWWLLEIQPQRERAILRLPSYLRADLAYAILLTASLKSHRAAALRANTEQVEAAKLPAEQRAAGAARAALKWQGNRYLSLMWSPTPWYLQTQERSEAQLRCAIATLALERYYRAHGQWPESLSTLVPALLAKVPIDPMDGKPLRYRRLNDGVVVYSIGPDRIDNGGKLDRKSRGQVPGTDIGIRLWDVAKRRQVPGTLPSKK